MNKRKSNSVEVQLVKNSRKPSQSIHNGNIPEEVEEFSSS